MGINHNLVQISKSENFSFHLLCKNKSSWFFKFLRVLSFFDHKLTIQNYEQKLRIVFQGINLYQFLFRIRMLFSDQVVQKIQKRSIKTSLVITPHPHYSIEKLLRETASLNRFKTFHKPAHLFSLQKTKKNANLPSIVAAMQRHKADMQAQISSNHSKLNSSFSHYFRNEVGFIKDELKKKKITKFKKIQEKRERIANSPPVDREEGGFSDMSLQMTPLPNRCFDSLFPAIRYNATLFSCDKQVYLLGGYHQQGMQQLSLLHRYDIEGRKWMQVKGQGQRPKLSPCFHSVQIYKNNMIIVGGVSFQGQNNKRFNNQLIIYNLQKQEWLRARGGVNLKHHASTFFGSTLMISGGINQKQKYSEDLHFITFTGGTTLNSLNFNIKNQAEVNQKIAHHKIVHTYELETNIRNQIKLDGVFSFGGEDQNGHLNNNLNYINVLSKVSLNLDIKFKKWQMVHTNQDKPCPRKDHSFNVINRKGLAVLAGGIEQYGNWLSDIWLFDFIRLQWVFINTKPRIEQSIESLAGHCACAMGTVVYLYNGNVQKKRQKAFWALETDLNNNKTKKSNFSTKLPTFKSIHSQENHSYSAL